MQWLMMNKLIIPHADTVTNDSKMDIMDCNTSTTTHVQQYSAEHKSQAGFYVFMLMCTLQFVKKAQNSTVLVCSSTNFQKRYRKFHGVHHTYSVETQSHTIHIFNTGI